MSISNRGSVDDIRCALSYCNPKTDWERRIQVSYLKGSIEHEEDREQPRQTVIKLINQKIKKLEKLKF